MRILIADDHPLFLEAMVQMASRAFEDANCCAALDFDSASAMVHDDESFDLMILDFYLPGVQGFSGLLELRRRAPATPVVLVTAAQEGGLIRQAAQLGVSAYLPKSTPAADMQNVLREVKEGKSYFPSKEPFEIHRTQRTSELDHEDAGAALTVRQLDVLRLMGAGKSNKEIARDLGISQETVKVHISAILRKLNVTSRTQAVVQAHRILSPESLAGS